jgi:hypothetical protein
VFTAWYALRSYIKQTRFVFKGLNILTSKCCNFNSLTYIGVRFKIPTAVEIRPDGWYAYVTVSDKQFPSSG